MKLGEIESGIDLAESEGDGAKTKMEAANSRGLVDALRRVEPSRV